MIRMNDCWKQLNDKLDCEGDRKEKERNETKIFARKRK